MPKRKRFFLINGSWLFFQLRAFSRKKVAFQYFTARISSIELSAAPVPADLHVCCCFTGKTFEKATKSHIFKFAWKHGIFNMDQNNQCFCKHFPPKPEKHCKHFYRKLWWKSGLSTWQCLALRQSLSPSPSQSYVEEARNTVTRILQYCRILQSNDHVKEASCCRGGSNSWELKPIYSTLNLKQHLCALMIKPSSKKLGSALFQSQRKTGVGSKLSANVKSLRFSEKKKVWTSHPSIVGAKWVATCSGGFSWPRWEPKVSGWVFPITS